MATKYKYDKDTDYAALMEQAARRGDNAAAAVYEQQRNAKIRGEGMTGQEQTSDYAQYLPIEDVPDYDDAHRREAEALLTGRGTSFAPLANATRAEACVVLCGLHDFLTASGG